MDKFDLAILQILQQDNLTPQRLIAERVNLSPAAVQRRVAALMKSGVIERNIAVVDPRAVGALVTVVVEVHLVSDQSSVVRTVKDAFLAVPEIQQCYHVTGNGGLILIALLPDLEAYGRLAERLFADNALVESYRSLPVLERVKVGLAVSGPGNE